MAITFIKEQKRQKYLILVAAGLIGVAVIVLWLGYFRGEGSAPSPVSVAPFYREMKIDFGVLENPLLKEFQSFEEILPFEGEKGRENPFLPY